MTEGRQSHQKKGIANVFGEFYSKLDAENQLGEKVQNPRNLETRMNTEQKSCDEDVRNEIPEFTQNEIEVAIDSLTKGIASDNNGILAEDIKTSNETKRDMIRQIFTEVLKRTAHQKHGEEYV